MKYAGPWLLSKLLKPDDNVTLSFTRIMKLLCDRDEPISFQLLMPEFLRLSRRVRRVRRTPPLNINTGT